MTDHICHGNVALMSGSDMPGTVCMICGGTYQFNAPLGRWLRWDGDDWVAYDPGPMPRRETEVERALRFQLLCQVYWGSHGCHLVNGHDPGPEPGNPGHECDCCDCVNHPDPDPENPNSEPSCVAKWPYYGPSTTFYGEDAPKPAEARDV
jgi:hypothetical protein